MGHGHGSSVAASRRCARSHHASLPAWPHSMPVAAARWGADPDARAPSEPAPDRDPADVTSALYATKVPAPQGASGRCCQHGPGPSGRAFQSTQERLDRRHLGAAKPGLGPPCGEDSPQPEISDHRA
jgi:hypothetical protein